MPFCVLFQSSTRSRCTMFWALRFQWDSWSGRCSLVSDSCGFHSRICFRSWVASPQSLCPVPPLWQCSTFCAFPPALQQPTANVQSTDWLFVFAALFQELYWDFTLSIHSTSIISHFVPLAGRNKVCGGLHHFWVEANWPTMHCRTSAWDQKYFWVGILKFCSCTIQKCHRTSLCSPNKACRFDQVDCTRTGCRKV